MGIAQSYILYYTVIILTTSMVFISGILDNTSRTKKIGRFLFWLSILLPVIISGYRYGIGTDYFNYERIYYNLGLSDDLIGNIGNTRLEPGWVVFNYLIKIMFDDVRYVFLASSLLIWLFNFKAIYDNRKYISIGIAVLILLTTLYNPSFNMVRQSLAMAIIMLSIKPIIDKRPIKFYIIILLAMSFHYTAIIFLPAYWIVNNASQATALAKRTFVIIGSIFLIFITPTLMEFLTSFEFLSYYSHYELELESLGVGNIIIKSPIILLIVFNLKKLYEKNNPMQLFIILYFIGLILEFYGYFAQYINRIALFYEMIQIFILAAIIKSQTNKYEKLIYSSLVVAYFIGWFTYRIIILNHHQTIPYLWLGN